MAEFVTVVNQGWSNRVKNQTIQTVFILLTNVTRRTSLFFMLSNNHVNRFITTPFDLSDDDILGHWVSLVKALSNNLNAETIQFFFNLFLPHNKFPLYSQSICHFAHENRMVRIAVRTITLNVFRVAKTEEDLRRWLLEAPQGSYLSDVVRYTCRQAVDFDAFLRTVGRGEYGVLEESMNSLVDQLFYLQDVMDQGIEEFTDILVRSLRAHLLDEQLIHSLGILFRAVDAESATGVSGDASGVSSSVSSQRDAAGGAGGPIGDTGAAWGPTIVDSGVSDGGATGHGVPAESDHHRRRSGSVATGLSPDAPYAPPPILAEASGGSVDGALALFLLAQLFDVFSTHGVLDAAAAALLEPRYREVQPPPDAEYVDVGDASAGATPSAGMSPSGTAATPHHLAELRRAHKVPFWGRFTTCADALVDAIEAADDRVAMGALSVIFKMTRNPNAPHALLQAQGLCLPKYYTRRKLLGALTSAAKTGLFMQRPAVEDVITKESKSTGAVSPDCGSSEPREGGVKVPPLSDTKELWGDDVVSLGEVEREGSIASPPRTPTLATPRLETGMSVRPRQRNVSIDEDEDDRTETLSKHGSGGTVELQALSDHEEDGLARAAQRRKQRASGKPVAVDNIPTGGVGSQSSETSVAGASNVDLGADGAGRRNAESADEAPSGDTASQTRATAGETEVPAGCAGAESVRSSSPATTGRRSSGGDSSVVAEAAAAPAPEPAAAAAAAPAEIPEMSGVPAGMPDGEGADVGGEAMGGEPRDVVTLTAGGSISDPPAAASKDTESDADGRAEDAAMDDRATPTGESPVMTTAPGPDGEAQVETVLDLPDIVVSGEVNHAADEAGYPHRIVSALIALMAKQPPARLVNLQLAQFLLVDFLTQKDGSLHDLVPSHRRSLEEAVETCATAIGDFIAAADSLGGASAVACVVEEAAKVMRRKVNANTLVSNCMNMVKLTRDANQGIDLSFRLPCQRLEEVQRYVETFLSLRRFVRVTLDGQEDTAVETFLPPEAHSLRPGEKVSFDRTPWISVYVPAINPMGAQPAIPKDATVSKMSSLLSGTRLAVVLGQRFLVFCDTVEDGRRVSAEIGTMQMLVPLHHVQTRNSAVDERLLVLRIYSASPLPFAWREPVSIAGESSEHSLSVWQLVLFLDTIDLCRQLRTHIDGRRERLLHDNFESIAEVLQSGSPASA